MKKQILISIVLWGLLFGGCVERTPHKEYPQIPQNLETYTFDSRFRPRKSSEIHNNFKRTRVDLKHIGKYLSVLTQKHFSPQQYRVSHQEVVSYNEMVSDSLTNNPAALLGYNSEENPFGLNPPRDQVLDLGNGHQMKAPILVADLYELALSTHQQDEVSVLSYALVLNNFAFNEQHQKIEIAPQLFQKYQQEIVERLHRYLMEVKKLHKAHIIINVYHNRSEESQVPGGFVKQYLYLVGQPTQEVDVQHQYTIIHGKNHQFSEMFREFQHKIGGLLLDRVDSVGIVEELDGQVLSLQIEVQILAKRYLDQQYFLQVLEQELSVFRSFPFLVTVKVYDYHQMTTFFRKLPQQQEFQKIYLQ